MCIFYSGKYLVTSKSTLSTHVTLNRASEGYGPRNRVLRTLGQHNIMLLCKREAVPQCYV
jgi:hypothetical protein